MSLVDRYFPFYRFNLTQNPFGTLTDAERQQVTVPPPSIEAALETGFTHLLVLGRKGRGKTTALHYVMNYLRAHGERVVYERLPPGQWAYHTDLTQYDAFALDEMQRIAPWQAWRLFREADGKRLVIGSHADHRLAFRLRGLPLTTVRLGRVASRTRLAQILERRLAAFTRETDEPPAVWFSEDALDWLWARYGGDLRSMNGFLYDVFAQIDAPGPITADALAHAAR